ncbi:hypothetical protein KXW75_004551 [Aspergillus fumigatus]|nr:hypothetical protein KXW75_004551 [Aspergillus fumigatus]KAH2202816.1 hypothetical protein KXV88_001789 [Aspergillus fumigatus]
MPSPLRIAVLECDAPPADSNARYGGYHGVFSLLLKESARALGQPDRLDPETGLDISRWDVVYAQEYPRLEDVDAILLTGSNIVFDYPPNVVPLGSSPRCAVQGMYRPGHFITVQGHPEFKQDIVSEIVKLRMSMGAFSKEQGEDALARAGKDHDGIAIGVAFLKFLLGDIQ